MSRVYNFSAGPAMLPVDVMKQAQSEFVDWHQSGISVMEISHRSEAFKSVAEQSKQDLRDLLQIPDDYHILFLQGGGRSQFAMVPMNLLGTYDRAAYVDFGVWGHLAMEEAKKYCHVNIIADTQESGCQHIPLQSEWDMFSGHAYLYTVDNETVQGLEFNFIPETGDVPLVSDMSSNLLSRSFDVSRYGLIFACAQKNLGPAGVTIVIIRDDLLQRGMFPGTPSMFNYKEHAINHSMLNTSPTYSWYMVGLVLKWVKSMGGVAEMERRNQIKSQKLYDYIDSSDFYINTIAAHSRSRMNVVFHLHDETLNEQFLNQASEQGLKNLKGHRFVGGMRASLYNAMPEAGVDLLVEFMRGFSQRYG